MTATTRFTFEEDIHGQGGFGKIRRGRDHALDRDVAVKILSPVTSKVELSDIERFRREAKCLAALSHPNIPAIYDVDFDKDNFQIYFQFIRGKTLQQMIGDDGALSITEVRPWFQQIASALEHAHALGIIHRDIKPDNIIVTENRATAYIVDFGIALTREESRRLTESGYAIGTLGYMSPEQTAGEDLDLRTDIYSLGITLYEALAGKRFPVGDYESLSIHNEAISPQIDELIVDCRLPKEQRVASAKAFVHRLGAALMTPGPLSEVLTHGKLHELSAALTDINSSQFIQLPPGQRALILAKIADVISQKDERLQFAAEDLLRLMLPRGLLLSVDEYKDIVGPAIQWGFHKRYGSYEGSHRIRTAIEEASSEARGNAHACMAELVAETFEEVELPAKPDWYLHSLRQLIQTLLANTSCSDEHAARLVKLLKAINTAQTEKR